jgi:hypothetical protein
MLRSRRARRRAAIALISTLVFIGAFIGATSQVALAAFSTQTSTAGGSLSTVTLPTVPTVGVSLDPQWYGQPFTSTQLGTPDRLGFGQISCPTVSDCIVVDENNTSDFLNDQYFVTTNAQSGPYATWVGGNFGSMVPKAVSCESTTLCYIAVQDDTGSVDGAEASFNAFNGSGGTWGGEIAYDNSGGTTANGLPYGSPTSISCFDPAGCVLVTTNGYQCVDGTANVATTYNAWTCTDVAGSNDLTSVSCLAGGPTFTCAMTDANGDLYTGIPWSGSVSEVGTSYGAWGGVDCASYYYCYAYGSVVDTWSTSTGTWTAQNVSPSNAITAMSCYSESECVVATYFGNSLVTVNANDGASATARWYPEPDNTTVPNGIELGMSCPSVYYCYESVGYATPVPPFAAVFTTYDAVQVNLGWYGVPTTDYNGNQIISGSTLQWTNSTSGTVGVPGVGVKGTLTYGILLPESQEPDGSGNTYTVTLFAQFGSSNFWYSPPSAIFNPWAEVSAPT